MQPLHRNDNIHMLVYKYNTFFALSHLSWRKKSKKWSMKWLKTENTFWMSCGHKKPSARPLSSDSYTHSIDYIVPSYIPLCVTVHPYLLYVLCDSPLTFCPSYSTPPPPLTVTHCLQHRPNLSTITVLPSTQQLSSGLPFTHRSCWALCCWLNDCDHVQRPQG